MSSSYQINLTYLQQIINVFSLPSGYLKDLLSANAEAGEMNFQSHVVHFVLLQGAIKVPLS